MKFSFEKRIISLFLTFVMLFSVVAGAIPVSAEERATDTTYVLAGADFQPDNDDYAAGLTLMNGILDSIPVTSMDGFLFGGDYNRNTYSTENGLDELKAEIQTRYGTELHQVYVQGNHDPDSMVTDGTLSPSGANDAEAYGVFVINEMDYMWRNDNKSTIENTAKNLKNYLDEKIIEQYTKPIFIISHLPLHYCLRTLNDGDGMYANLLFDPINAAAADGLNIIFLYGHNHSNGWDDYLGGSAVYLEKGDSILIAQSSQTEWQEETLNFTYMNPGYVSYYSTNNTAFVDDLTMSVFEITEDSVTVTRYDDSGVHDLKNCGLAHANGYGTEDFSPNTEVKESPRTITLSDVITDNSLLENEMGTDSGTEYDIDPDNPMYVKITSTEEIVSGDDYIIVMDGSSTDYLLIPESVTKNSSDPRTGYDFTGTSIAGESVTYGDYSDYEWTIEERDGGFVLIRDGEYSYLEYESSSTYNGVFSSDSATVYQLDASGDVFAFVNMNDTNYCWDRSSKDVVNAYNKTADTYFYIYRQVSYSEGWVELVEGVTGESRTEYIYTKYTGSPLGQSDLIIVNGSSLTDNSSTSLGTIDVEIDGTTVTLDTDQYEWSISGSGEISTVINGTTYYLTTNRADFSLSTSAAEWDISNQNGNYTISRSYRQGKNTKTVYFNGTGVSTSSVSVNLYQLTGENHIEIPGVDGEYVKLTGPFNYVFEPGTSVEDAKTGIYESLTVIKNTTASDTGATQVPAAEIVLTPNGDTSNDYTMTVTYQDKVLGEIFVAYQSNETSTEFEYEFVVGEEGTVSRNSTQKSSTRSYLKITENGTETYIPITVGMLSDAEGNIITTETAGDLTGLTVTYRGQVLTDNFTLHITDTIGNDYPQYPDGGSVTVDKIADASMLQTTGVVNVELSTAGIPVKKGTDVIVMVDTSSSMNSNNVLDADGNETETTRLAAMENSLIALVEKLQSTGPDGEPLDVRIAIADFNGYYTSKSENSPYYIDSNDHLSDSEIRTNGSSAQVYTGSRGLDLGAFVDAQSLVTEGDNCFTNEITASSGTNYDYAFDAVYQLGEAVKTDNAARQELRDLYVIFMSDGAPFQYNYFSSYSDASLWNDWLMGTLDTENGAIPETARADYYNEDGKHWMAEAVKGTGVFDVIRKNDARDTDGDNWIQTEGLGATVYSIGFALAVDNQITAESMEYVVKNIASNEDLYFNVNTAEELTDAFSRIGTDIIYAATDAYFVDQLGECFDIQLSPMINTIDNLGNSIVLDLEQELGTAPDINVYAFDIYTEDQVGETVDGTLVTAQMVGKRYGDPEIIETVSCNTEESSLNVMPPVLVMNSSALGDATANIYDSETGLLTAKYFWYNANKTESCDITLSNGTVYTLEPETFYWNIGIINNKRIVLSYYAYLEGSMEGDAPAGSYSTNEYATLYYKNWLGNDAHIGTTSPSVGWQSANVSYAFYLVDENGEPIVNLTTGATGSFYNSVKLTNPVVYNEIFLNSLDDIDAIEAKSLNVLPEGYELYDDTAEYKVVILSEDGEGSWTVTYDETKGNTSYVTGYYGANASNEPLVSSRADADHDITEENGYVIYDEYDYTHTTVWFAVVYQASAISDTVVVDYGLDVDISVLVNDMFGENAVLTGLGTEAPAEDGVYASAFGNTELTLEHGAAAINGDKVRYTPSDMNMTSVDTFFYEVKHTTEMTDGNGAVTEVERYYYGEVNVVPAATLYYEETFATFENSTSVNNGLGEWVQDGAYLEGALQDEDRPGDYSYNFHEIIDNNNLYGFDSVNANCSTFSLGSAMKVTVDSVSGGLATAPKATFTFTGTGFDLISLTDNDSGVIRVTVYNDEGALKKFFVIDNYYGYAYQDGSWIPIDDAELDEDIANDENCIWQVPVIKANGLPYDTYNVKVEVIYFASSDHRLEEGQTDGSYSFWFDAVRIYDPADDTHEDHAAIIDAYIEDGEYAPYYRMVKEAILEKDGLENLSPDMSGTINGAVFIDGIDSTSDMGQYSNPGPNNEAYLANGQSVSFKLYATEKPQRVHLGAKMAFGTEMLLSINGSSAVKLNTSTDMYYSMNKYITWILNSEGTWETEDAVTLSSSGDGVISLTNIKLTAEAVSTFDFGFFVDAETVTSGIEISEELFSDEVVYLAGDADMNGTINARDMLIMRKAVLCLNSQVDVRSCDFDGDGKISGKDVLLAKQVLLGVKAPVYISYEK